jgi:hypothetical protein
LQVARARMVGSPPAAVKRKSSKTRCRFARTRRKRDRHRPEPGTAPRKLPTAKTSGSGVVQI